MTDTGNPRQDDGATSVVVGDDTVAALHRDWVLGWERNIGDPPRSFRRTFGPYYDWDFDDVLLYDDVDPEHRMARSPAAYGAIWEPGFNAFTAIHHVITDGPQVLRSGRLAASSLVFEAHLRPGDGPEVGIRTTTALVWRLTGDGWRIVREHNSTSEIPAGSIDVVPLDQNSKR